MPKYTLIQYSKNYRKTARNLWNYYKDKLSDDTNNNNNNLNKNVINSESFKHKKVFQGVYTILKAHWQIPRKWYFKKYSSCDQECQFSAL